MAKKRVTAAVHTAIARMAKQPSTQYSVRMRTLLTLGLAALLTFVIGCTDVRDFEGTWAGPRVGEAEVLRTGFEANATATLEIERVDLGKLRGALTITGTTSSEDVFAAAPIQELPAAEADVLSELTFTSGQPARVFVTLVPTSDGDDAMAFVSLHREDRVELRVLRGGNSPLYGIFYLERP